jgi:hypothetical protein
MTVDYSISKAFSDATRSVTERMGAQIAVWGVFFAIQIGAFIVFAVMMGGSAMALAGAGAGGGAEMMAGLGGGMILFMIVFYLAILAIAVAAQAAQVTVASHLRKPSVGDAVNNGFRSALPLFGAMVLLLIAYFAIALVVGLIVGIAAGATGSSAVSMLVFALVGAALAYVVTKISMLVPVVALDGERNPINAISKSWNMTNGKVLPVLGTYLVFVVAMVVVLGAVVAVIAMTAMGGGAMPGFGTMALMFVLYIIALVGITIYASSLTAAVHQQLSGRSVEDASKTFS